MSNLDNLDKLEIPHALKVLVTLRDYPGVNRSALYKLIDGSRPTVQKRVDALIEDGFIIETQSLTHSRGKILKLTELGQAIADRASEMDDLMTGKILPTTESKESNIRTSTEEGSTVGRS